MKMHCHQTVRLGVISGAAINSLTNDSRGEQWMARHCVAASWSAEVTQVKLIIGSVLLWVLIVSLCAHADSPRITRPFWAIFVTITDKTTGERMKKDEIVPDLRFDDRAQCESIVAKAGSIPDNHDLATVLTCRQITGV